MYFDEQSVKAIMFLAACETCFGLEFSHSLDKDQNT